MPDTLIVVPIARLVCPSCATPLIVAEPVAVVPPVGLRECDSPLLTTRQREVLMAIAGGHSTKQIATNMHLGRKTVETHRSHLMDALGIHDVASLTRFVVAEGWIIP